MSADAEERAAASTSAISSPDTYTRGLSHKFTETAPANMIPQNLESPVCARTRTDSIEDSTLFSSATSVEGEVIFDGGVIASAHSTPPANAQDENTTAPNATLVGIPMPIAPPRIGTSAFNEEKYSENLDSGISPTFHPRVVTTATTTTTNSMISTPVGSAFSLSSRGCTSATAPSTTSSTSSTASFSTNQTRARGNATSSMAVASMNQFANRSNPSATPLLTPAGVRKLPPMNIPSQPQLPVKQSVTTVTIAASNVPEASGNVDRIDSALLSALCDQRERKGLLRLEQVLIDFMNERNTGFIEVGGPNNSIVIGGQTGGRLSQTNCEEVRGRQTSFQRLCLHRLADRFNIVRESSSTAWTPSQPHGEEYMSSGNCSTPSGPVVPGLIRLVKVKNSRIPINLLIDLDVEKIDSSKEVEQIEGTVRSVTDNLAQTNITQNGDVVVVGRRGNQQPRRKMQIMKRGNNRSMSGSGSHRDKESGGSGRNSIRGKNLSDKEKAYAEARARIFKDDAEYVADEKKNASVVVTDAASVEPVAYIPAATRFATTFSTRSSSPAISNGRSGSDRGFDTVDVDRGSVLSLEAPCYQVGELESETPHKYQGRISETQNGSNAAVASSTNGAMSKVTWRNRRQEENDPDFRRGVVRSAATNTSFQTLPQMHYGGAPGAGVFVAQAPTSAPPSYGHHLADTSYGMLQQNSGSSKSPATNAHYHPQQHHYYGSASHLPSHHQYSSNSAGHHSYVIPQQQQQQHQQGSASPYYAQHQQSNPNLGYFSQQSQEHQVRQQYHRGSGSRGNYVVSGAGNQGIQHGMFYNANTNSGTTSRRSSGAAAAAIYNMEEFPALG